jgi:hypothetical protein
VDHSLESDLTSELQGLLVWSSHRIEKARNMASKYLDRLITSFPSLMCDSNLVFAILDVLTLLQNACDGEYIDEVGTIPVRRIYVMYPFCLVQPSTRFPLGEESPDLDIDGFILDET